MRQIESAALIGLGAMGVFFAPRMEQYLGREHFSVIAEGKRKERLENQGVTINGAVYRFRVTEPQEGTPVDLIIMAVKDMGLDQAICDISEFVGKNTQILCVMNGVESEERVAAKYGWEHVLYSFMRMSVVMKDGKADFDPYWGKIHFGEASNAVYTQRVKNVQYFFEQCDIPYEIDEDMMHGLWFKFMCNVGENLTCAMFGIPFGFFGKSAHADFIREAVMHEVLAIAQKKGIALTEEDIIRQRGTLASIPKQNKPSTLQDLEAGRKTEIEMFAGTVMRLGNQLGISTPISEIFYHGIRILEEKNEETRRQVQ